MAKTRRIGGFTAVLIGLDKVVLDRKIFSAYGSALKYVSEEGLNAVQEEVAIVEILSPEGDVVYCKTNAKVEDQGHNPWAKPPPPPKELFCRRCQKKTSYRAERRQFSSESDFFCSSCGGRIYYA
jgi:hypothetical protein